MWREEKKNNPAKMKTFECIKIMNARNPASFIVALLYVHLTVALCQSGPLVVVVVVVIRLVFA